MLVPDWESTQITHIRTDHVYITFYTYIYISIYVPIFTYIYILILSSLCTVYIFISIFIHVYWFKKLRAAHPFGEI